MDKDETFLLMSIKDPNSKDIANTISNETSRKIISYLSEKKEATETQIAKDLKLPLTTVHYNIKQLLNSKLIQSKEFYWSKKGKEMAIYQLAKKFIIIAPSDSENALSKLKSLLPITLIAFVGSGLIYLFQKTKSFATAKVNENIATGAEEMANQITVGASQLTISEPNYALWFLIGSISTILLVYFFSLMKKR